MRTVRGKSKTKEGENNGFERRHQQKYSILEGKDTRSCKNILGFSLTNFFPLKVGCHEPILKSDFAVT